MYNTILDKETQMHKLLESFLIEQDLDPWFC